LHGNVGPKSPGDSRYKTSNTRRGFARYRAAYRRARREIFISGRVLAHGLSAPMSVIAGYARSAVITKRFHYALGITGSARYHSTGVKSCFGKSISWTAKL